MPQRSPCTMDRREFLRVSGLAAAALAGGSLLAACSGHATTTAVRTGSQTGTGAVTLPFSSDNSAVASDLAPERNATLRILEWREYLSHSVVADFANAHNVDFEITSFENRDKGASIIQNGGAFDIFFPTIDQLGSLVDAGLLQPLNHDYIPNVGRLWPQFAPRDGAFYDRGLRYSVPYTVFSTGIGWRSDLVATRDAPAELDDPYSVYWNPKYRGKVGLYDDYREAIATAILRNGSTEVDTTDPSILDAAETALHDLVDRIGAEFDTDGAYEGLPKGEFAIHQAWSGDILSAGRFGSAYTLGTAGDLRYFWPDDGRGIVGADLMAIPAKAPNPVLAHLFLNHMLDPANALRNFAWNGYQPPVEGVTRGALTSRSSFGHRIVPSNLANALLSPGDVDRALTLRPLSPSAQNRWLSVWSTVPSSADVS
ncbi:MAG: spermidine/putrescine ABC transporter substrate-binding protein [Actinomycetota bacterium]